MKHGLRLARSVLVLACVAVGSAGALAQPHEAHADGYTLRSSTVRSTAISTSTALAHGIEPARNRAILNVVVQRQGGPAIGNNVPAAVQALVRNLAGMEREVPMRRAKAPNGEMSYVGTFDFASREVLDFRVRARPQGAERDIELVYRERMPAITD